jgi:hypothetical protein
MMIRIVPRRPCGSQGASDAAVRQSILREHSSRTSGRRNFTASFAGANSAMGGRLSA